MPHVPHSRAAAVEFGRRVRERRTSLRMTQSEVAEGIDAERSHVSRMERGKRPPSFGALLSLARVLGLDPGTLIRGLHRL